MWFNGNFDFDNRIRHRNCALFVAMEIKLWLLTDTTVCDDDFI